jgi:lysophospholipase L1-like esterase
VSFEPPVVSGGTPPISVACTPPNGSSVPVGVTAITCTARDAEQRTASCTFQVTVTAPSLTATKFVAFGDSITEGEIDSRCPGTITVRSERFLIDDLHLSPRIIDPVRAYPNQLQTLLRARYVEQTPTVTNAGKGGECAAGCPAPLNGVDRLPGVIAQQSPQVVLLQEGINNINSNNSASIPVVVGGLRTMIRDARGRGATVFVGTLLPERAGACRGYAPGLIAPANDQIRAMVSQEGAILVDLYAAFGGVAGDLIGTDGLHPNEAGYQKIAETFFDEIKARLEAR